MPASRFQEDSVIHKNLNYRGDYFHIEFYSPQIAAHVRAGQFVDIQLPDSPQMLMRRPFSVFDVDPEAETFSILYKRVGQGTAAMAELTPDAVLSVLGPLGNGFPEPPKGEKVIIVAGGYGCAATYLIAKRNDNDGVCLIGGRSDIDILLEDEFAAAGHQVRVSTDDGSRGHHGLVTDLLEEELETAGDQPIGIYACGPNAMLQAVAGICQKRDHGAFVSLDQTMCCGVGACFTCVVRLKADNEDGWRYARSCREGPVFHSNDVHWE